MQAFIYINGRDSADKKTVIKIRNEQY